MAKTLETVIALGGRLNPSLTNAFNQLNSKAAKSAAAAQKSYNKAFDSKKMISSIKTFSAVAGAAIVAVMSKGIALASDLQEVQNVVDVTFGKNKDNINDWSQSVLNAYGLSELSAKKYASTMGAMLKSSGVADEQLLGISKNLTQLTGDFASFYNLQSEAAFDKIRAGLSGETEPLKQIGINMSVANLEAFALSQGIKESYSKMSQANQVLLRYNYLMKASKDAQGDFGRTRPGFANQMRLAKENTSRLLIMFSKNFLPALTPVIAKLNQFMGAVKPGKVMQVGAAISGALTYSLKRIEQVLKIILPIVVKITKFFINNWGWISSIIWGVVAALVAFKSITIGAMVIAKLTKAMRVASAVWSLYRAGARLATIETMLFNTTLLANPIGIIIALIVGAVVAFVLLWKKCAGFRNFFIGMGKGIVGVWKNYVIPFFKGIPAFFSKFGKTIFKALTLPFTPFILGINAMIIGLNKATGKNFPTIPSFAMDIIPKFAKGGTINAATLAMVGEAGTETIVPHNTSARSRSLAMDAVRGTGLRMGGDSITMNFNISGGATKDDANKIVDAIDRYYKNKRRVAYQ